MKKSAFVILSLVFLITVSFRLIKDNLLRYENLKVLPKDTDKRQMDSVMKHFSAALGVNCNFCHVRKDDEMKDWDFASDANKHKEESREMFKMMMDINKKYFGVETKKDYSAQLAVSCYSCHQGKEHPPTIPPPAVKKRN